MIVLTVSVTLRPDPEFIACSSGAQTTGISCQRGMEKSDTVWHRPLGNQPALKSRSCVALSSWLVR